MQRLVLAASVVVCLSGAVHAQDGLEVADDPPLPAEAGATSGAPSAADTARARVHFKMGVEFYREGNLRAALIEFQRAYRTAPHYKLLYNLGQTSAELQEYASAIDYFVDYLRGGGSAIDSQRRAEVEEAIRELEARIATVTVTSEEGAEILVDDTVVGRAALDRPVRVGAGRRQFVARKDNGQQVERTVDVAAGDHVTVDLSFDSAEAAAAVDQATTMPSEPVASGPSAGVLWVGAATLALGAATGTMAVLTGLAEKEYEEERRTETTASALKQLRDDAEAKALATDILLGTTIAAGTVTLILWLTDSDDEGETARGSASELRVSIVPRRDGVYGGVTSRF